MLIAYISADEVNRDLAARMGANYGAEIQLFSPRDSAPDGRFDGVLYDLESVTRVQRELIVAQLLEHPSSRPVAVHFYDVDGNAEQLREQGVIFNRQLKPSLVRTLCRSAASNVSTRPRLENQWQRATEPLVGQITVSALGVAVRDF
jgi:hypothetical protein